MNHGEPSEKGCKYQADVERSCHHAVSQQDRQGVG
jgi:hypothetical protein